MSAPRRVTVVMTPAQFEALAAAVAQADNEWEQDGTEPHSGSRRALNNGWSRIRAAWYATARPAARGD